MRFIAYRDRIGVPSEIQFLRRQYLAFSELTPFWVGRHVMPRATELGGEIIRLGGSGPSGWLARSLFRHLGLAPRVGVALLAPVLHAQFARGAALALPLARGLGSRMVVTLHGGDVSKAKNWRRTIQAGRWPAVVAEAARFVCVSHAVAETAGRHGVPETKLTVLPIGVELPPELPPAPSRPNYLFVGRFVPKKGIIVLEAALRTLRGAGDTTPLLCLGDGPLRPRLEALAREVGGVELPGWLPPEAVQERMRAASCLLVPSVIAADGDAEGLPSVIPEAMAQGCPVIGSAQGGIAEVIHQERTGLLVAPGDSDRLAQAMRRLVSEPALRHALAQEAFADARVHLNARIQSAALESLLLAEARC
ncbi:MAG: glycosyltransferase [Acetobacteraceae bacterium]|nr:glycosyltransferase [Acetobacteraceae bacterium]